MSFFSILQFLDFVNFDLFIIYMLRIVMKTMELLYFAVILKHDRQSKIRSVLLLHILSLLILSLCQRLPLMSFSTCLLLWVGGWDDGWVCGFCGLGNGGFASC